MYALMSLEIAFIFPIKIHLVFPIFYGFRKSQHLTFFYKAPAARKRSLLYFSNAQCVFNLRNIDTIRNYYDMCFTFLLSSVYIK